MRAFLRRAEIAFSDGILTTLRRNLTGNDMLRKSFSELHFVRPKEAIPTVEVDIDSLPDGHHGCADILRKALYAVVSENPTLVATIYVYVGPSTNFVRPTYSAFIGVAGPKSFLIDAYNAFLPLQGVAVRYSDYIQSSDGRCELHIEEGKVWLSDEPGEWYSIQDGGEFPTEDADDDADLSATEPIEEVAGIASQPASATVRSETPARFRAARADARIDTIRATIESVFGLPAGSVALCGIDGKSLRGDATIRTLRKRWDK